MGFVYIQAKVSGPKAEEEVRFLVDSGAKYSLLPKRIWQRIGLRAKRTETFVLTDGTFIDRDVSECLFNVLGREGHSTVILGEAKDKALLGVITLETLGMILNPFTRELQPMQLILA
ncbi:MAG: aspartyl protease [Calditrichaeota bacterium]|nr:aspartyl protease [Calditrichota bacterium]